MNVNAALGGEHKKASAAFAMLAAFVLVDVPGEVFLVLENEVALGAGGVPSRTVELALYPLVDRGEFASRQWHF